MEERFVINLLEKFPEYYERHISPKDAELALECEQKFQGNYLAMAASYNAKSVELKKKEDLKRKRCETKLAKTKKKQEIRKITEAFEKRKDNSWREYSEKAAGASHLSTLALNIDKAGLTLNCEKMTLGVLVKKFEPERGARKDKKNERPELYTLDQSHLEYIASLTEDMRKLIMIRDTSAHGSWAELESRLPREVQQISEMRLYEQVNGINLSSYLQEYSRKQRRYDAQTIDEFITALEPNEISVYAAIYFSKRMKNISWDTFIGDQEKLLDKDKTSIFARHSKTIERNINVAKELKKLEEKFGSFGLRFATEKQLRERDRIKIFYFVHMEGRDAELVRIRDSQYKGNIDEMIERYQVILKQPNADQANLTGDIERLKYMKYLRDELFKGNAHLYGFQVKLIDMVNEFEGERKQKPVNIPNSNL